MSMFKILKEAQSKLINHHIENLITLKPFNNRLVSLILSLESLSDLVESLRSASQIQTHTAQSLRKLVQHIKWRSFNNQITSQQFRESCSHLRHSLAYFEPESELELRSGDGIEEFIFAVYEVEKKHSGIDYLSLDDEPTHNFQNTNTIGSQNSKHFAREQSSIHSSNQQPNFQVLNIEKEFDEQNSAKYDGLWTVAEASNEEGDSDNPENQKNSPKAKMEAGDQPGLLPVQEEIRNKELLDLKVITP